MATRKRDNGTTGAKSGTTTADAMEQRMLAFAEQLGRIVGSVQSKAEGWLESEALTAQIAGVRDSAAELLQQLAGGARKRSRKTSAAKAAPARTKGRSGGVVDAPGKRHRKPMVADPGASLVD